MVVAKKVQNERIVEVSEHWETITVRTNQKCYLYSNILNKYRKLREDSHSKRSNCQYTPRQSTYAANRTDVDILISQRDVPTIYGFRSCLAQQPCGISFVVRQSHTANPERHYAAYGRGKFAKLLAFNAYAANNNKNINQSLVSVEYSNKYYDSITLKFIINIRQPRFTQL